MNIPDLEETLNVVLNSISTDKTVEEVGDFVGGELSPQQIIELQELRVRSTASEGYHEYYKGLVLTSPAGSVFLLTIQEITR